MKGPRALIGMMVLGGCCQAAAWAASPMPTVPEVESAMKQSAMKQWELEGKPVPEAQAREMIEAFQVRKVLGCFPAYRQPPGDLVCLVDWWTPANEPGEFDVEEVGFHQADGVWTVLLAPDEHEDLHPACAPIEEVQVVLRQVTGNAEIVVRGPLDGGRAVEFTEENPETHERQEPVRLLCRYEVDVPKDGKVHDRLFLTRVRYEEGKFHVDPDWQEWDR